MSSPSISLTPTKIEKPPRAGRVLIKLLTGIKTWPFDLTYARRWTHEFR
jgi:hypothetical protein